MVTPDVGRLMWQELRLEDCTSQESGPEPPWEETMRLMPPLLELMDMFNIVCRRCKSNILDADLLKGRPPHRTSLPAHHALHTLCAQHGIACMLNFEHRTLHLGMSSGAGLQTLSGSS
jgi:hypothetical protein